MIYEPYSIVVVPFPFTDKEQIKRRPALVLSSITHQKNSQHVTLIMITSAKNSAWPSDYLITSLTSTGLTSPSIIRQKIFTIDSRLIIKCVGTLSLADKSGVRRELEAHLE